MKKIILAVGIGLIAQRGVAYENVCTHPKITTRAVELLNTAEPDHYLELSAETIQTDLTFGVRDEDNPNSAVLNHFYDPRNRKPLNVPGNNIAIGVITLGSQQTALARAAGYWSQAVIKYKANSKDVSYALLGRTLHLLTQDMAQPGHTHNDPHIPYGLNFFGAENWPGLNGSDAGILEASAENLCNSSPQQFPAGTAIQMAVAGTYEPANALSPLDFGETVSRAAYVAASFSGGLGTASVNQYGEYSGTGAINVNGNVYVAHYSPPDPNEVPFSCQASPHWLITGRL